MDIDKIPIYEICPHPHCRGSGEVYQLNGDGKWIPECCYKCRGNGYVKTNYFVFKKDIDGNS